jgi:hypothetical protein
MYCYCPVLLRDPIDGSFYCDKCGQEYIVHKKKEGK